MEEIQEFLTKLCSKFKEINGACSKLFNDVNMKHGNQSCLKRFPQNAFDKNGKTLRIDNDKTIIRHQQSWDVLLRIFLGRKSNSSSVSCRTVSCRQPAVSKRKSCNHHHTTKTIASTLLAIITIQLWFGFAVSTPHSCASKLIYIRFISFFCYICTPPLGNINHPIHIC